jgi:O-antigen/teichoic acid export membrane protein
MTLAVTQGFKVMRFTAYCQNLFFPIANILLVFGFSLAGGGLLGVAIPYVLSVFLSAMLALYYLRKVFPDFSFRVGDLDAGELGAVRKDLFGFSSPLFIIVLLTTLFCWSDTLMLGYFRTSHEVGVYSAAVRTAMLMTVILLSFNLITSPMVAELHSKNESGRLESLFKFTSRWIYTISMLLFLEMILFSSEIMSFFGAGFAEGWFVLVIVGFTYFINSATGSIGVVLVMSGHQKLVMYDAIGVFVFNVVANYILIPLYGMAGAAVASAASIIGYNLLILAQVFWKLKIHPYNKKFIEPTLSGVVVFAAVYFAMRGFSLQGLGKIAVFGPVSVLFFMLLIFTTSFHEEDKMLLARLGDRFKRRVNG